MARELEKQGSTNGAGAIALGVVAFQMEETGDQTPLALVFGGEGACSVFHISPRDGAEILLLLERAGWAAT